MTVHLKDVDRHALEAHDVPVGTGVANIKGVLAELNRQRFSGLFIIEYESNRPDNDADVAQCIKFFNDVRRSLGG